MTGVQTCALPILADWPIGARVETTFGQSGFFGYGFCSPDPADGLMWWSTQPAQGVDAATFRGMSHDAIRRHLLDFHRGWHDPIPQILAAAENIVTTDTLDVATLPMWSRGRTLLIGDYAIVRLERVSFPIKREKFFVVARKPDIDAAL